MPFRAQSLQIASSTFIVPDIKGAHTVEDQKLGPSGPVEFTFKNPTGEGMLSVTDGIEFQPNKYLSSKGADGAFPGQILIQPQATTVSVASGATALSAPIKQVDAVNSTGSLSAILVENGTTVHALNYATPRAWTTTASLNQAGKDIVVYGGRTAIAYGGGYIYGQGHPAAYVSVPSTPADFFGVLGSTLHRAVVPNTVYAGTGGSLGTAWDSGSTIGDSNYNINSLAAVEQIELIGKADGIYSIDADGTVVPFTPELRGIASSNFASTARVAVFNGDYYFATDYGLIQISGADGAKRRIGLDQLASPDIPTPQLRAICSDDRYLYALVQNTSTDLMILRRDIHGSWNTYYWDGTAGTKQGQHIGISSALGYPALFFSYYDGSSVYTTKAIRPSVYPNPIQDSNYRYSTLAQNHYVRLGRIGPLESNIVLDRCTVLSENLTASISVTPYVANEGGAAAQFGASAAQSSPYTEILPSVALEGKYFDVYAYLTTNDATISPVLKEISFKGYYQPGMRRLHKFLVAAEGEFTTEAGDVILDSPVTTINNLTTLRTTDGYATIVDESGVSFAGAVVNVGRVSESGITKVDGTPKYLLEVTVVEAPSSVSGNTIVSLSGASVLDSYAKASLPTVGNPGRLVKLTDYDRGVWKDTGTNWVSIEGEIFNVKQFGAVGDGVADDTAAINAAIAAAGATGSVFFPIGTYLTTSTLTMKSYYKWFGAGRVLSKINYSGSGTAIANDSILTDYPQLHGLSIINIGTGTIGLDIGKCRRGQFSDLSVQSFTTNYKLGATVGVADYFNMFRSCQSYAGTTGFKLGDTVGANANFFDGCENYNDTTGILITSAVGCQFRNHHIEGATSALTITAGDSNDFDIYVEASTNAGTAASGTYNNRVRIYLDGTAAFTDSGWNDTLQFPGAGGGTDAIQYRGTGEIYDKRDTGNFTAATKTLFSVTVPNNAAYRVTVAEAGLITSVDNYSEVGSWDLINKGGGGVGATLVARTGSTQLTVGVATNVATFSITGNASFAARYQYTVHIVGTAASSANGTNLYPTYTRL